MIRTLIFGAIAGYVGKKLYDEGKLTSFKDDLVKRVDTLKADYAADRPAPSRPAPSGTVVTPASPPVGATATH
ncbi:hypothetical protein WG908_13440 [Sphingobium sp. AN641]|uniref:hypothetical protein n=1 Tax=Sphingobium sp. AN641 TaxID=3133443 RepID=UPI0030C2B681